MRDRALFSGNSIFCQVDSYNCNQCVYKKVTHLICFQNISYTKTWRSNCYSAFNNFPNDLINLYLIQQYFQVKFVIQF